MSKWREKKSHRAPVVEMVKANEGHRDSTRYSATSALSLSAGRYSESSQVELNRRAAYLLNRSETVIPVSDDGSSMPIYGGSVGGGYANYTTGTTTSNYAGSVGGQSAYTAYSAGSTSGVASSSGIQRNNAARTGTSGSTTPNRSKTPSLSNLVNNKVPMPPPPIENDGVDDDYEIQRTSGRESALEENPYEDPDKRRSTPANNPVSKHVSFSGADAAHRPRKFERQSDEDYLEPDTLTKSPEKLATGPSDGLESFDRSFHRLPARPPMTSSQGAQAAASAAQRTAAAGTGPTSASAFGHSSQTSSNKQQQPHLMDREYSNTAQFGPAPSLSYRRQSP